MGAVDEATDTTSMAATTVEDRQAARDLVAWLHVLLESARSGDRTAGCLREAVDELANVACGLHARNGRARLELRARGLWVAGQRYLVDMRGFAAYASLTIWLRQHGLSALEILPARGGVDEIAKNVRSLARATSDGTPIAALALPGLEFSVDPAAAESDGTSVESDPDQRAPSSHHPLTSRLGSVFLSQPLVDAAVEMGAVDLRIAKGIVQGVVDRLHAERALLPGLTRLQAGGKPMLRHAAAVCLFSVLLGRRLGLSEEVLLAIGAGALLHDVGRIEAARPDPAGHDEGHAAAGFLLLIRSGCRTDLELRAAEIVRRHHEPLDEAPLGHPDGPALLPAIVGVADAFDRGSHIGGRFTPEAGLWELRRAAFRDELPAVLVDAFVPALEQAAAFGAMRRHT